MDTEVIRNYFLSAGSSFRRSSDWQKEFIDATGKSSVRRSGRFGVGILSAFLIGEEIHVETRKIDHQVGYRFDANINDEQINILKDSSISEGTIIKIKINNKELEKIKVKSGYKNIYWYDWYTLSNPIIKYYYYGKEITPYKNLNPDNIDILPEEWHAIDSEGYNKIQWTYSPNYSLVNYACNGIVIPVNNNNNNSQLDVGLISVLPQISIFDYNAVLPLTLDRNNFSDKLSFSTDLLTDLYKDLIAYILVFDKNSYVENKKIFIKNSRLDHPGIKNNNSYTYYHEALYGNNRYQISPERYSFLKYFINLMLISKKGFILNYNYFIQKLKSVNAILMQLESLPKDYLGLDIQDRFILITDNKINAIGDYLIAIEASNWNSETEIFDPFNSRIFLKTEKYKYLFKSDKKRMTTWLNNKCEVQFEEAGFTCLHLDNPKSSLINNAFLKKNAKNVHFIREYEIICPFEGDVLLNNLLEKYIGNDVVIPFTVEERRKKYPIAFKELKGYMEKYISKPEVI